MFKNNILAIETSCDETAIALVTATTSLSEGGVETPHFNVLAEAISSQIDIHRPFGGVVPSLAKREHLKNLPIVLSQIEQQLKNLTPKPSTLNPNSIAVTVGPGLEPALWTGINFAKELSVKIGVPLTGVNHLEGHIYSNWLSINGGAPDVPHSKVNNRTSDVQKIKFPAIVLVVSGGHTILLYMEKMKQWIKLGETQDDAVGEAFDKVAKMLGLPYPGGPEVEKQARQGRVTSIDFPRPLLHSGDYHFSFSGLKTAVLYYVRDSNKGTPDVPNICASFQAAALDVLVKKTMRAAEEYGAQSILLCGGVAANKTLRAELQVASYKLQADFYVPELKYNTDNAVMIAAAAYLGNCYPAEKALSHLNL